LSSKIWEVATPDWERQRVLCAELRLTPPMAQVLINRGLTDALAAREFMSSQDLVLPDPYLLPGIREATRRLSLALDRRERILVYGDYDADGVTGTALLVSLLRELEGEVDYYIPDRAEEGYGLSCDVLYEAWQKGTSLVVTVDCGISSIAEVGATKDWQLDVIVTDHHEPSSQLPEAVAVVNPMVANDGNGPLAGVGVVFKLAQALAPDRALDYLDLVALGTIADMIPLVGQSRTMVRCGLSKMTEGSRPGLAALMEVAGVKPGEAATAWQVGFQLAPRINAAGRLGSAMPAVELLLTDSRQRAWELALQLHRDNQRRQAIENQVCQEIEQLAAAADLSGDYVIVLASPLWHAGIVGIAASRLLEKYYRPVVLIALEGSLGKGSARSIPGFPMHEALARCSDLLVKYGGHKLAAGFTVEGQYVDQLRERLNQLARIWLKTDDLQPRLAIDMELLPAQVDLNLAREIGRLAPYGPGNPEPVFAFRRCRVLSSRRVGKEGAHLKMVVDGEPGEIHSIAFRMGEMSNWVVAGEMVDLAFTIDINYWHGGERVQLVIRDIKTVGTMEAAGGRVVHPSGSNLEGVLTAFCPYLPGKQLKGLGANGLPSRGAMGLLIAPGLALDVTLALAYYHSVNQPVRVVLPDAEYMEIAGRLADYCTGDSAWRTTAIFRLNQAFEHQGEGLGYLVSPGFAGDAWCKEAAGLLRAWQDHGMAVIVTGDVAVKDRLAEALPDLEWVRFSFETGQIVANWLHEQRFAHLVNLLREPRPTLIWTATESDARDLIIELKKQGCTGVIGWWDGDRYAPYLDLVNRGATNGWFAVVAAGAAGDLVGPVQRVVLWNLPGPARLTRMTRFSSCLPITEIIFLVDPAEIEGKRIALERMYPSRDLLRVFYRELAVRGIALPQQRSSVAGALGISRAGERFALQVFNELGFLEVAATAENGTAVRIIPGAGTKKALMDSARYREGMAYKQTVLRYLEIVLRRDMKELVNWLGHHR